MKIRKKLIMCIVMFTLTLVSIFNFSILTKADDTYEGNDTFNNPAILSFDRLTASAVSYISTSLDVDFFAVNITHTGLYSFMLTNDNTTTSNPYGNLPKDYDVIVFDPNKLQITMSTIGGTTCEGNYFTANTPGYYYIKIYGYSSSDYDPYQPYRLTVQHGDAAMYTEAARYRDYNRVGFYDRQVQSGTQKNDYWHSVGVAYGYGSKDSISHYSTDITNANMNALSPFDSWDKYNFPNYPRPGRYDGDSSTSKNCGIDCSGFIQRCAQASYLPYTIALSMPLDSGDGLSGNWVPASSFGGYSSPVSSANLQTGDISYWSTHIVMFAKINPNNIDDCKIIEASGDSLSNGGRKVKESYYSKYSGSGYAIARLSN